MSTSASKSSKKPNYDIKLFAEWINMDFMTPKAVLEHTVGSCDGLKFSVNPNDHPPAHLHVMRNKQTIARLNLNDNSVMSSSTDFTKSDLKRATNWLNSKNANGEITAIFHQYNDVIRESVEVFFYYNEGKLYISRTKPMPLFG